MKELFPGVRDARLAIQGLLVCTSLSELLVLILRSQMQTDPQTDTRSQRRKGPGSLRPWRGSAPGLALPCLCAPGSTAPQPETLFHLELHIWRSLPPGVSITSSRASPSQPPSLSWPTRLWTPVPGVGSPQSGSCRGRGGPCPASLSGSGNLYPVPPWDCFPQVWR